MNKLEPVIAFIDERLKEMDRLYFFTPTPRSMIVAKIEELEMIKTLCQGLIKQDELLNNALDR